jgi:DNA polymerase I-like protein with 3'-5' exonuclease and polymerase domains
VLKATCGIELPPDWDTMTAARLLDENELAGLKIQYITKIDPSQAKYDIEALFENIQYAIVDPHVFALYAATDSMMTFKLYEYQKPLFELPENERVYWIFKNIEMPIVVVTAEMELRGVSIDTKFGKSLKLKYKQLLDDLDAEISEVLNSYEDQVSAWKLDPLGGGSRMHVYMPKKSKKSQAELEAIYTYL